MIVRGKKLALLAGSCAVLLLAAVSVVYRDDIATAYYLQRMEWEPTLVVDYLERDESPALAEAVEEFARTEKGQQELLDGFLAAIVQVDHQNLARLRNKSLRRFRALWVTNEGSLNVAWETEEDGLTVARYRTSAHDYQDRLEKIQETLGHIGARTLTAALFPGVTFSFVPADAANPAILFDGKTAWRDLLADEPDETRYFCIGMKEDLLRSSPRR